MADDPPNRRRGFRDIPIKQKLMVILMATTASAMLVSGVGIVITDAYLFRGYLQRDLTALAQIIGDNSTAALAFDDPQSAEETLGALRARTHLVAACIYRMDGTILAAYAREKGGPRCPPAGESIGIRQSGADLTVWRPIVLRERRIGTLVLVYDLGEINERKKLYGTAVLAILGASSLLAFFLSSGLRSIIATPIVQLAQITASVSSSRDYGLRAPKLSHDELGALVDGFNEMLGGIQSRDKELRQALQEREEALEKARNARDSLKTTLASIGDAVISTDSRGCVVFANGVAQAVMRWPEAEMAGQHLDEVLRLINERTRARVDSPVARVLREGSIVGLANHTLLIARDGTEVPIDDSAAPILNERGEVAGVVLIFRDITERKRADDELRATREQLQLITDTMAAAVTRCSREQRYVWVSRRYAEWLGSTPEEIARRAIPDVIGPEAYATIGPHIERTLAGRRTEYEALVNFSTIGRRWIHAVYVPTHNAGGEVDGWVAEVSDITALKEAQAELARSNEDLERFAFVASHDLQEPLRMITTYAQLLARTYPDQTRGEPERFIGHIVEGAKRMRELLADLLAYSEIGALPNEPVELVDLNEVFVKVKHNLKAAIDESGALLVCENLPRVAGYDAQFVALLQNLVGNAIKYRSAATPSIRVSVRETPAGVALAVADNGIGIEPQYHAQIFELFKRLHGKRIPGTGMGLSICQRIVERYGGRIWVESQAGEGAVFVLTLPTGVVKTAGRTV